MRSLLILVAVASLALSLSLAHAQNPVTNGGFEEWTAQGVPVDWSILGQVKVSDDAHSGKHSVLMTTTFLDKETGLNRDWAPNSGQQGTMLSELKGGIRFWYKVPDASSDSTLHFFIIPMSKKPIEDTGEPRVDFQVPAAHFGDGKWHQGVMAYDFADKPEVKWVHLSPRIFGSHASLLLDDVEWLPKIGPLLSVARTRWEEDKDRPGERATLTVVVKNCGDEPTRAATVTVKLPPYLRAAGQATAPVPQVVPDDTQDVPFVIEGRRDRADTIDITASVPGVSAEQASAQFRLEPKLEVVELRPQRFILAVGEETVVEAVIRGRGTAICRDVRGELGVDRWLKLSDKSAGPIEVAPGQEQTLKWRVKALQQVPYVGLEAYVTTPTGVNPPIDAHLVIGPPPKEAPDQPGAHIQGDTAWLQGNGIRLVLHKASFGFGIADLQVKSDTWKTVARIPRAGRLVTQTAHSGLEVHQTNEMIDLFGAAQAKGEALSITCREKDWDGANWTCVLTYSLRDGGRNIGVTSTLRSDKPAKPLAFDGPMLYAGEGSFGSAKDEALFPGLEWLDKNEESSNALVIKEGHPHQIRYVPHPNMITIPLMSVHEGRVTVGLLWDAHQKWDGDHDRPAACFASPDRFGYEPTNAHLMGLFVPSVGAEGQPWVKMNDRQATTPYDLPAQRELTLSSILYARADAPDALSAMDEWFRIFGVPQPSAYPRGTPEGEAAFSMQAYLKSLWVPEEKTWWTTRGAGKLLSPQGRPMSFVHDLLKGALVVQDQDPALAEQCRARANEVLAVSPGVPAYSDSSFDYGDADNWLIGSAVQVPMLIAGQGTDGAWRFDANLKAGGVFKGYDYHRLGPDKAAELGTCAAHARDLLRVARMTGSTEAYDAGIKSLRFMNRFRVPRAAQVWEVMVQAPDILAAAEACEAYLEAYQYDGNKEWLDRARQWARGGLPFVYMWQDPKLPFLLGASIPVFGASCETGSWFGRPVQWNGLRHAEAMLKLARYDHSMPWEQLARLITASAMYQQSTNEDDIALWPDSISALDGSKAGWIFSPLQILDNLYTLTGRKQAPDTVILGKLPERIHLNSGAEIKAADWKGDAITAKLAYPARESGFTVLVNVSKPTAVLLDGKPLAERQDLRAGDDPGWRYLESYAMCVVRITRDGEHDVRLDGARCRRSDLTPALSRTVRFEFSESTEGWLPAHAIGDLSVKDGALQVPITAGDPYLTRSAVKVDGSQVREIVVRMRIPALPHPDTGQWYWGTKEAPGFAEERVEVFPVMPEGQWHEYHIAVGDHPQWKGHEITAIRLDPLQAGDPVTVEVDWIHEQ